MLSYEAVKVTLALGLVGVCEQIDLVVPAVSKTTALLTVQEIALKRSNLCSKGFFCIR